VWPSGTFWFCSARAVGRLKSPGLCQHLLLAAQHGLAVAMGWCSLVVALRQLRILMAAGHSVEQVDLPNRIRVSEQ